MNDRLAGKVAIVTGSARGIGRAYAERLAELGAHVVVADINEPGAKEAAGELEAKGFAATSHVVDISDPVSAKALAASTVDQLGAIDILVNNAALYAGLQWAVAEDVDLSYWKRMVDVNISGMFYMCRAVIPTMRAQERGKIVNQASGAAYLAAPLALHYCVTKAAAITMTKVLAKELGEDNINVNAIAPGIIGTEATQSSVPEVMQEMVVESSALKRAGTPADLLGVLEFLCTAASDYMTGQTLVVDGGIVLLG